MYDIQSLVQINPAATNKVDGLTKEQIGEITLTVKGCLSRYSQTECKALADEMVEKYRKENIGKDLKVRYKNYWVNNDSIP